MIRITSPCLVCHVFICSIRFCTHTLARILALVSICLARADQIDIIDEAIDFFRANVLFRQYDPKGPADRVLCYLTIYIGECLRCVAYTGYLYARLVLILSTRFNPFMSAISFCKIF
jgi:hypothetical protein